MKLTDQQKVIETIEEVRMILGLHIQPGPQDAKKTVEAILAVMDNKKFLAAVDRLKGRQLLRLVE